LIGLIWIGVLGFCVESLRLGVLVRNFGVGVLIPLQLNRLLGLFFLVSVNFPRAIVSLCEIFI